MKKNILAIIWDYDGTIVDSNSKNFIVNKKIFHTLFPLTKTVPTSLQSINAFNRAYHSSTDFRDFYKTYLGYSPADIEKASALWSQYQKTDQEKVTVFEGMNNVLQKLHSFNHAICSQNCSINIRNVLQDNNLHSFFNIVIGFNDLNINELKPHPAGFIRCLEKLQNKEPSTVIYIGDHEQDIVFANNARRTLQNNGKNIDVISIAANYYEGNQGIPISKTKPNYVANKIDDIVSIIEHCQI